MVQVIMDTFVKGKPKMQLWVAAAPREEAFSLVVGQVPEGWTAVLFGARLEPEEVALPKRRPGDARAS